MILEICIPLEGTGSVNKRNNLLEENNPISKTSFKGDLTKRMRPVKVCQSINENASKGY